MPICRCPSFRPLRTKSAYTLLTFSSVGLLALALSGCGGSSSSSSSGPTGTTTLAAHYTYTDLGAIGSTGTLPTGISNAGVITGHFNTTPNDQAFRHTGASPVTVADGLTPPPTILIGNQSVDAAGINNAGTVAGSFQVYSSSANQPPAVLDAFVYDTSFHDLGSLPLSITGISRAAATAINDNGTITGYDDFGDQDQTRAFRHTGTGPLTAADDLGTIAGYAHLTPAAINQVGTVAGTARASGNTAAGPLAQHLFIYDTSFHDLGVLPGFITSYATGINASGVVIGLSAGASGTHSFRHSGTGPLTAADDLGAGFVANAINTDGDVVGLVDVTASIVKVGGTVQSLAPLVTNLPAGFGLQNATAINDQGQIVGYTRNGGVAHAWLLTPAP